jgi:hypothetical protein
MCRTANRVMCRHGIESFHPEARHPIFYIYLLPVCFLSAFCLLPVSARCHALDPLVCLAPSWREWSQWTAIAQRRGPPSPSGGNDSSSPMNSCSVLLGSGVVSLQSRARLKFDDVLPEAKWKTMGHGPHKRPDAFLQAHLSRRYGPHQINLHPAQPLKLSRNQKHARGPPGSMALCEAFGKKCMVLSPATLQRTGERVSHVMDLTIKLWAAGNCLSCKIFGCLTGQPGLVVALALVGDPVTTHKLFSTS